MFLQFFSLGSWWNIYGIENITGACYQAENDLRKEDKFLTFPLGLGFPYRYLNFMKDPSVSGLTLQEHLDNKGDFARLLNIIPNDSVTFSADASRLLWDELIDV
jgi:hypothetical protein